MIKGKFVVIEAPENSSRVNRMREEYVSRINRIIDYIESNLDQDLSLETLAGIANFSRFHPCFEICHNDPKEHPEHKHIVDICVPVKPL